MGQKKCPYNTPAIKITVRKILDFSNDTLKPTTTMNFVRPNSIKTGNMPFDILNASFEVPKNSIYSNHIRYGTRVFIGMI